MEVQQQAGPTLREFKAKLNDDESIKAKIAKVRAEIETFALRFPMPGHDHL